MIQLDGYYIRRDGVVTEEFEGEFKEFPLSDKYAKDVVTTSNANIQAYSDEFISKLESPDSISFAEWIKYNEGLMEYIRAAANTVHILREHGYDYKVNMQSGLIK